MLGATPNHNRDSSSWIANATSSSRVAGDMHVHPLDDLPMLQYFFVICLALQSVLGTIGNLMVRQYLMFASCTIAGAAVYNQAPPYTVLYGAACAVRVMRLVFNAPSVCS